MMDKLAQWIAWHLPRSVVKWCGYRIGAAATCDEWGRVEVPALTFVDAMQRWEDGRG